MNEPARATPEEAERYLDASLDARLDLEVTSRELDAARARIAELEAELAEMDEARVSALNLWRMSVHGVTTLADLPGEPWTTSR